MVALASPRQTETQDTPAPADVAGALRSVLRGMPGPVALISTRDPATGRPAGLAASAVVPVSMAPPSMLVCVNRGASAHAVIEASGRFCINLVGPGQRALVGAFGDSAARERRFGVGGWGERHGLPHLPEAPACIFCLVRTTLLFGTHEAFVGEVFDVATNSASRPMAWMEGSFACCAPLGDDPEPGRAAWPAHNTETSGELR